MRLYNAIAIGVCLVLSVQGNSEEPATNGAPATGSEPPVPEHVNPPPSQNAQFGTLTERLYDFRLRDDLRAFPTDVGHDLRSLFSLSNALTLGMGGGLAALAASEWDDDVRANTARHARRFGGFNNAMDVMGHPAAHLGIGAGLYATSLIRDEPELHATATTLLHALLVTDGSVLGLKYAFDTTRPNGERRGFPSGHVASSFAAAAVLEEHAGPEWGMAGYTVAGLVAWHRIDDRKHDLSDVIFGAALGSAIGTSIVRSHRLRAAGIEMTTYADGEATGLLLHKRF